MTHLTTSVAILHGVTTGAVVISDAEPQTEEWYAARRQGITATDLPKIVGDSKYGNPISVWMDKRGEWDDDLGDPEAAEWGNILEPVIDHVWKQRHDAATSPVPMLCRDGWMIANLDRIVVQCPEYDNLETFRCALEIKTRSAFVQGNWRDDMPDDVLAQVAWQRIVTGFDHIHVACLLGGQRLTEFTYYEDPELETFLIEQGRAVWQSVQDGIPPDAAADSLLVKVLDKLYPNREGVVDLEASEAIATLDAYEDYRLNEQTDKAEREKQRARLIQALKGGEVGLIDKEIAYTYKANRNGVRSLKIADTYRKESA